MFAIRFLLIVLLAALCFPPAPGQADKQTLDVRVMSYNIRYGTAQDGENHWDKRKEFLVETIQAVNKVTDRDFENKGKIVQWLITLNQMRAAEELSPEQARELNFDLGAAYEGFKGVLE